MSPTAHFAWTAFAGIHTLVDPEGAAKTSSLAPSVGGGVRLLFQYVFTNAVPAAMAEQARTLVHWPAKLGSGAAIRPGLPGVGGAAVDRAPRHSQ